MSFKSSNLVYIYLSILNIGHHIRSLSNLKVFKVLKILSSSLFFPFLIYVFSGFLIFMNSCQVVEHYRCFYLNLSSHSLFVCFEVLRVEPRSSHAWRMRSTTELSP